MNTTAPIPEGWTECEAMNLLQEHGRISDECVTWDDVHDQKAAAEWLGTQGVLF